MGSPILVTIKCSEFWIPVSPRSRAAAKRQLKYHSTTQFGQQIINNYTLTMGQGHKPRCGLTVEIRQSPIILHASRLTINTLPVG